MTEKKTTLILEGKFIRAVTALMILLLSGCGSIGPRHVTRDRFNYVNAISDSSKEQMLLNIVKVRYSDLPVFLDISQVISQYSLEREVDLGASWSDALVGDSQNISGTGAYTDSPTIIFNPLMGQRFTKQILTPIPPSSIFSLIQARWPVDSVLRISLDSINGIHNSGGGAARSRPADPEFPRLLELLADIQKSGHMGMRVRREKEETTMVSFLLGASEETVAKGNEARDLLGISREADEVELVFGALAANDREIAVVTRSMLEILIELASYIEAPPEHIEDGRVYPDRIEEPNLKPLIRIYSDARKPENASVAVSYQDHWFWIDERDPASKRMLSFVMLLFSLAEPEAKTMPTVTIPTK